MLKLILHIAVAAALWFGLGHFGLGWLARLVAVVIGAFGVHYVWERFANSPFLYLGARPFSPDDPLMVEAVQKARSSLDRMRTLYPEHCTDTVVRFPLRTKSGRIEQVWGDLLELGSDTAKVYLRTLPVEEAELPDRTIDVALADISDWQIEMPDGSLRGGFTNRAMFRIFEREEGAPHPAAKEQLARFKDV
jgi:uncharacterized protein YegJ (DUF2314 family)